MNRARMKRLFKCCATVSLYTADPNRRGSIPTKMRRLNTGSQRVRAIKIQRTLIITGKVAGVDTAIG